MKTRLMVAVAAVLSLALFAGCATNGPKPIPPAQILAIACPPTLAAIQQFEALDASMPAVPAAAKAGALLVKIQPAVTAACSSGSNVSLANVQAFAQTVLPALGQVAAAIPMPPVQLAQIEGGLTAAEIAVGAVGVVQQQIEAAKAAKAAPAPASTAAPAK